MADWLSLRPSDFLLFSPRTYQRLFELYNAELWPAQILALALGLALLPLALRPGRASTSAAAAAAAGAILAGGWLWVAWAFHWQRYAAINWAALYFAAAFALQGLLLLAWAAMPGASCAATGRRWVAGAGLLAFGVVGMPCIGVLAGRSWRQTALAGLTPDATAVATLGALLLLAAPAEGARGLLARALWPIPLLWCAVGGATQWTMGDGDAWVLPATALLAVWAAIASRRAG